MELFQQLVKELKALAERAAVGLPVRRRSAGEEAYPAAAPLGEARDAEAAVGVAPPAGRRCKRPDRCADNDCTRLLLPRRQKYLGQMDELGELRRRATLSRRLSRRKGCSA